jgi:tetratricopeptide (TPR) repeat protein
MAADAREALRQAVAAAQAATGLDDAVAAWAVALQRVAAAAIPADVEAQLLNAAATARLQRARTEGPEAEADAAEAVRLYRRATELHRDDPMLANNLGAALRTNWQREQVPERLDQSIAAFERALSGGWLTTRLQLGELLRTRYRRTGGRRDLDGAVEHLTAVVHEAAALAPAEQAEAYEALGNALYDLADADGSADGFAPAVKHLRRALELLPADDVDRRAYTSNLASALLGSFEANRRYEDLVESIRLLDDAVAAGPPSPEMLATLGNALAARSEHMASREDANQAVGRLREAVELSRETAAPPGTLAALAAVLLQRFDVTGTIADVDEAVGLLDEAVSSTDRESPERVARLNNLAVALRQRHLRRRSGREDLDRAVAAYEDAIGSTPEDDPERRAFHANLGNVLHQRYDVTQDPADLERAVRELETAVAATPEDSPERPMYLNNLGATLSAWAERRQDADALRRAADVLGEGLKRSARSSAHRADLQVNLANALSELARIHRDPRARAAARRAYRSATRAGAAASPAAALGAARNWAEWASGRRAWAEVAEAYELGEQVAERLFRTQLVRADKESWLRDADGLAADGAFARASRADLEGAVTALERGRAYLYSERLEREQADLHRLRGAHDDLAIRYRELAALVGRLEGLTPDGIGA